MLIRDIIRNAVNASESDSVVFVGNGVTGAVHKLIHALDFKQPPVSFLVAVSSSGFVRVMENLESHGIL